MAVMSIRLARLFLFIDCLTAKGSIKHQIDYGGWIENG